MDMSNAVYIGRRSDLVLLIFKILRPSSYYSTATVLMDIDVNGRDQMPQMQITILKVCMTYTLNSYDHTLGHMGMVLEPGT